MCRMTKHLLIRRLILLSAVWLCGLAFGLLHPGAPWAAPCEAFSDGTARYAVCTFDVTKVRLRLFWAGADGKPYETFAALAESLREHSEKLAFAMNAGMFQPDFRPVGL